MKLLKIYSLIYICLIWIPSAADAQYTLKYISSNDLQTNLPISNLYILNETSQKNIDSIFFNLSFTDKVSFSIFNDRNFVILEKYSSENFSNYFNYNLKIFIIIDEGLVLTQNLFFSTDTDSIKFLDQCCIEIENDNLVFNYITIKNDCNERKINLGSLDFYNEFLKTLTEISTEISQTKDLDEKRLSDEEIIMIIEK